MSDKPSIARIAWMLTALCVWTIAGCTSTRGDSRVDWQQLHVDHQLASGQSIAQGGYLSMDIQLSDGTRNRETLEDVLREALSRPWVDSGEWPYPDIQSAMLAPVISERGYWAFVYANLTGRDFAYPIHDPGQEDEHIAALLDPAR